MRDRRHIGQMPWIAGCAHVRMTEATRLARVTRARRSPRGRQGNGAPAEGLAMPDVSDGGRTPPSVTGTPLPVAAPGLLVWVVLRLVGTSFSGPLRRMRAGLGILVRITRRGLPARIGCTHVPTSSMEKCGTVRLGARSRTDDRDGRLNSTRTPDPACGGRARCRLQAACGLFGSGNDGSSAEPPFCSRGARRISDSTESHMLRAISLSPMIVASAPALSR